VKADDQDALRRSAAVAAPLVDSLVGILDHTLPSMIGPTREALADVRTQLREPVRVAVAGRVNAGKSTLVNSLMGQRVAPTDVSECTRVVTWYRYGTPQRMEVRMRDGTKREELLGEDGRLPSSLGVDPTRVAGLDVWLADELLQTMTLVDTPGLGSLNAAYSDVTHELLAAERASRDATAVADALVFVFNQEIKQDELDAIRTFGKSRNEIDGSAPATVAVLSKADKLAVGPRWWDTARRRAASLAEQLADEVATVLPIAGLMAETAEGGVLTEVDAAHLGALAAMEAGNLALLLLSGDRFTNGDCLVPTEARHRLLAILDIQGISDAISFIQQGAVGAGPLQHRLSMRSGIEELRSALAETFRGRGEAFKLRSGIDLIEKLCFQPPEDPDQEILRQLHDRLEQIRLGHPMHRFLEMELFQASCQGQLDLPPALAADIRTMACGETWPERLGADDDLVSMRRAAAQGEARWRTYTFAYHEAPEARAAQVMQRSFALAWSATASPEDDS
jgi:GTPase SAR1 family protein